MKHLLTVLAVVAKISIVVKVVQPVKVDTVNLVPQGSTEITSKGKREVVFL